VVAWSSSNMALLEFPLPANCAPGVQPRVTVAPGGTRSAGRARGPPSIYGARVRLLFSGVGPLLTVLLDLCVRC
jgi:hypothetical protein